MKIRSILLNSLIFVACMFLAADITSIALRGRHLIELDVLAYVTAPKQIVFDKACHSTSPIPDISKANHAGLQKLSEYQDVCQSYVTNTIMIFTDMPKDSKEARNKASDMAKTLKEFQVYNVRPLIIVEPVTSWGFVDFAEFRDGFYDTWMQDYFKTLKANGITDQQMGIWVPFPEANLPYWNHQSVKPVDFGLVVNKYLSILKNEFPGAHASILLNSASYDNSDFEWSSQEYISLLPYVRKINSDLVDSVGMQGFPWAPRAGSEYQRQFEASSYLNADLVSEAAEYLNVDNIWLNTGSFAEKYTLDEQSTVTITPETRQSVMTNIKNEAQKLKKLGYTVSINLFAQDKSASKEETNWSYWPSGEQRSTPHAIVFRDFATSIRDAGIELWLFDQ